MATAPFCNVTVSAPAPAPVAPQGFVPLPHTATLPEVIRVLNKNLAPATLHQVMSNFLNNALDNGVFPSVQGAKPAQKGDLGKEIDRRIGLLSFAQKSIDRKTIKVENPNDHDMYIYDDRVKQLTFTDQRTGARWTFDDPRASRPNTA